jgi:hypothetical protein
MKTDITALTLKVLQTIEMHSFSNPITYGTLAEMWNTNWRTIAGIVEQLRLNGYKIGSNRNNDNPGCFLAKTPEEMAPTVSMMIEDLKTRKVKIERMMDWNNGERTLFQQMPPVMEELNALTSNLPRS